MTFQALVYAAGVIWIASCAAAFQSFQWSRRRNRPRHVPSLMLSGLSIAGGVMGLTILRVDYSESVNGVVRWHLNSRWFFAVALILGLAAFAHALWRKFGTPPAARPS
jgi:hypothetical protein